MKPIIIKTQDGININITVKELEEIIDTIYEQGVNDGKLQEKALKNTQYIVPLNPTKPYNPNDWITTCDTEQNIYTPDSKTTRPTVKFEK